MNSIKKTLFICLILSLAASACGAIKKTRCVKIKKDSMCKDFGSKMMRWPNSLLGVGEEDEDVKDIYNELRRWQPLIASRCHSELKRFLCSVYTPICIKEHIEKTIYPCKRLCDVVKKSCEPLMISYRNYSWPFDCSKFENNNMCVEPLNDVRPSLSTPEPLNTSSVVHKTNKLQKWICNSDFVVRARIVETRARDSKDNSQLKIIKIRITKTLQGNVPRAAKKRGTLRIRVRKTFKAEPVQYLVIGKTKGKKVTAKLVVWRNWKKLFKKVRCSS